MRAALRDHWPEYAMEAAEIGCFMLAACFVVAFLEHPVSPLAGTLGPFARRAATGVAMGLTAIAIVYSPWGRQSGAHFNPAVTLTFFRLGRVAPWDAAFYVVAQCLGAALGVALAALVARELVGHPTVSYAATRPGAWGTGVAFAAELAISCGLMTLVLTLSGTPRLARFTGLAAGVLVATYITLEAPLSGMSMNPARTLGSAVFAGPHALWIYFTAPPLGMLLAAELHVRLHAGPAAGCAKLHHDEARRCIFCTRRKGRTA
jgi:aquaporin Z